MPYKDRYSPQAIASQRRRNKKHKDKFKEKYKAIDKLRTEYFKNYHKYSPVRYKRRTINNWKLKGVKDEDYDSLFNYYNECSECMICLNPFDKRINKHLDHDHITGEPRFILCRGCNCGFLNKTHEF